VVDGENPIHQQTEKAPVMADQNNRAGKLLQGLEKNFDGLDIEMIGGLVENEEIQGLGQEGGQHHPTFFSAREVGDALVHIIALQEKGGAEVADHPDIAGGNHRLYRLKDRELGVEQFHGMLAEIAWQNPGTDTDRAP